MNATCTTFMIYYEYNKINIYKRTVTVQLCDALMMIVGTGAYPYYTHAFAHTRINTVNTSSEGKPKL